MSDMPEPTTIILTPATNEPILRSWHYQNQSVISVIENLTKSNSLHISKSVGKIQSEKNRTSYPKKSNASGLTPRSLLRVSIALVVGFRTKSTKSELGAGSTSITLMIMAAKLYGTTLHRITRQKISWSPVGAAMLLGIIET